MPRDFTSGRDAHPIYLLVLVGLSRPGCELVVPMLFPIALCRQPGQLALLIHMQHPRSCHTLLMDGSLHRLGIDGLPVDGLGQLGGREPAHFKQVALQLALVYL